MYYANDPVLFQSFAVLLGLASGCIVWSIVFLLD